VRNPLVPIWAYVYTVLDNTLTDLDITQEALSKGYDPEPFRAGLTAVMTEIRRKAGMP
jgi:hypothetical protein